METAKLKSDAALADANVSFTNAQSKNTMDDNAKQLAVAIDRHFQEWADLEIKAAKEGMEKPVRPDFNQIIQMAKTIINPPDKGQ